MENCRSNINLVGNTTQGRNVGGGSRVFKDKSGGNILNFRTISPTGASIQIYEVGDKILISGASGGSGSSTFIGLTDTPNNYVEGKWLKVSGSSLVYADAPSGGVSTFTGLTDTPNSYSGQGNKWLKVKSTADGLEFTNAPTASPAGSDTHVQYNDNGAFGASSNLTYNGILRIGGSTNQFRINLENTNTPLLYSNYGNTYYWRFGLISTVMRIDGTSTDFTSFKSPIIMNAEGSTELYFNGSKRLSTYDNGFMSECGIAIKDGVSAPATNALYAQLYIDVLDGDLKIKFGDGTVKTIVTDD